MKIITLCLISAFLMAAKAQQPYIDAVTLGILNNCRDDHNVSEQELAQLIVYKDDKTRLPHNVKCYIKCIMEKFGFYKNNILDELLTTKHIKERSKQLSAEPIRNLIRKCGQSKGADPCDTASEILLCFSNSEVQIIP